MYNVLHVIGHIGRGGDTTVVLDVMKNMDCSKFHFDFITHKGAKEEVVKELRDAGSKVYVMDGDVRELGLMNYYKSFLKALKQMDVSYDAIHVHTGMQSGVALAAARKAGISKRICHSHVTAIQRKTSVIKKLLPRQYSDIYIQRIQPLRLPAVKMLEHLCMGKIASLRWFTMR